jgi:hypothetical protein
MSAPNRHPEVHAPRRGPAPVASSAQVEGDDGRTFYQRALEELEPIRAEIAAGRRAVEDQVAAGERELARAQSSLAQARAEHRQDINPRIDDELAALRAWITQRRAVLAQVVAAEGLLKDVEATRMFAAAVACGSPAQRARLAVLMTEEQAHREHAERLAAAGRSDDAAVVRVAEVRAAARRKAVAALIVSHGPAMPMAALEATLAVPLPSASITMKRVRHDECGRIIEVVEEQRSAP